MPVSEKEGLIETLIQLLGEKEEHLDIVGQRLVEIGPPAIPQLERVRRNGEPLLVKRAAKIIESIQYGVQDQDWAVYAQMNPAPLEEGVFLLARFSDPTLDLAPYRRQLNQMASTLQERISRTSLTADVISIINRYLFQELNFSGNTTDYYLPENSYIHTLLTHKKGIPISLSVLVLLLAKRLSLPIYGIGMPGHFLIQWSDAHHEIYIDPFNNGRPLTRDQVKALLTKDGGTFEERYLQCATPRQILARMMNNLIRVYQQMDEEEKVHWLSRFQARLQSAT